MVRNINQLLKNTVETTIIYYDYSFNPISKIITTGAVFYPEMFWLLFFS